jgi:D-alanyl-D-alanine carboxypeptidase (penicillin-binding protein 5/6)
MLRRAAATGALACATALLVNAGAPAYASGAPAAVTPAVASAGASATDTVGGPALASPGIVVHRTSRSTPLPTVQADSWLVADLTTGEVLAAKGAHHKALPASMLKTLTAVTLMPALDPTKIVTATYDEARADGGHVGIVPGATYSVWDLWHGLLLPSANDAAAALADANGGMAATVAQMQAKAAYLHADDTTVRNNSGLDHPGQLSSAYDMALFARAAMQIADFRTVTQSVSYDFPGRPVKPGEQRHTYKIYSQNRLLLHGYKGTVGGKTGFTSLAHRTFWGAATRGGHTLVVTLFQIKDPTEKAARALLDWGFANVDAVVPVGTLVEPGVVVAPSPSASPSASEPATSGGTSAAGTSPSGSRFQVPWLPLGLVVAVLVAIGVWWRRRRGAEPWESLPDEAGASTASVLPGPLSTPAPPAAQRTSSVVVTTPAVRRAPDPVAPATAVEVPALVDPDATGPVPVVTAVPTPTPPPEPGAGPVSDPPVAVPAPDVAVPAVTVPAVAPRPVAAPEPAAPEVVAHEPVAPEVVAAPPVAVAPPEAPSPGGHVRVIRPPSRPS